MTATTEVGETTVAPTAAAVANIMLTTINPPSSHRQQQLLQHIRTFLNVMTACPILWRLNYQQLPQQLVISCHSIIPPRTIIHTTRRQLPLINSILSSKSSCQLPEITEI